MIYFFRSRSTCLVKIGTTQSLSQRIKALLNEHGEGDVLGVLPGGHAEEKQLHQKFAPCRKMGEWFEPIMILEDFILKKTQQWNGIDDVPAIVSVKIDVKAAALARKAASLKEKTLAEYLTDVVLAAATKDVMSEAKKIAKGDRAD